MKYLYTTKKKNNVKKSGVSPEKKPTWGIWFVIQIMFLIVESRILSFWSAKRIQQLTSHLQKHSSRCHKSTPLAPWCWWLVIALDICSSSLLTSPTSGHLGYPKLSPWPPPTCLHATLLVSIIDPIVKIPQIIAAAQTALNLPTWHCPLKLQI